MARPRKSVSDRRTRKLVFWVNDAEMARYLINATQAALTPTDFARRRLCFEADHALADTTARDSQLAFEHIDALNRVGTAMARLVRLAEKSEGGVPLELQALLDRIEALLQRELPP